jgi:radical SAM protein with 4Fe4S-binding SPASM domain
MTVDDLRYFIAWLAANRLRTFLVSGGEPTEYAYFSDLMRLLDEHHMEIVLASNNLFGRDTLRLFSRKTIRYFLFNYNKEGFTHDQHQRFIANVRELRSRGFPVGLKLNVYRASIDRQIIALAAQYRCSIYMALSCPGYEVNTHVSREQLAVLSPAIVSFVRDCKKQGIPANFSRPVIPCAFSNEEIRDLKPSAVRYRCNTIPVINPDLSVFPCLNIFESCASLKDFSSVGLIRKAVQPRIEYLRRAPLSNTCTQCRFYIHKKCQGGCLAYKQERIGGENA